MLLSHERSVANYLWLVLGKTILNPVVCPLCLDDATAVLFDDDVRRPSSLFVLRHGSPVESDGRRGRSGKPSPPSRANIWPISACTGQLHRRPPAETETQENFRVRPPSVHQMVLTRERAGFSEGSRGHPAASNHSLMPTNWRIYADPAFNRSKSPCRGTRSRSGRSGH
jgi:hypothetical protein